MIDFTTLQGLTIPEGVVTQITDESGNVVWSAKKYIRPTADISVGSNFETYPTGSAVYACIGEEVADGDATYIYTDQGNQGLTLLFSANLPTNKRISKANFVVVGKTDIDGKCGLFIPPSDFVFDGVYYGTKTPGHFDGTGVGHTSAEYTTISYPILKSSGYSVDEQSTTAFPAALNAHIASYGGEFTMEVPIFPVIGGSSPKQKYFSITQVYIELEFD